jgi:hypothetical protein
MGNLPTAKLCGLAGVVGLAGVAGLATGLSTHAARPSHLSAAAIVAARFPSNDIGPSETAPSWAASFEVGSASGVPSDFAPVLWQRSFSWTGRSEAPAPELFSPAPAYPGASATVAPGAAEQPRQPVGQAVPPPSARQPEVAPRHPAYRPGSVLNDAQIASIKARLNLTPEQEAMWPPVEAALRRIAYTKNSVEAQNRRGQGSAPLAYINPESAEIVQLKYAALPLFMRLNDDQKREVTSLAHVMGLSRSE